MIGQSTVDDFNGTVIRRGSSTKFRRRRGLTCARGIRATAEHCITGCYSVLKQYSRRQKTARHANGPHDYRSAAALHLLLKLLALAPQAQIY